MKPVMYHYVRGETERPPDYYYLDINDFRRQLDYFGDNFGFVSKEEFLPAIRGHSDPPSGVILTFDDGLRDHYDVVFPELQKRGIWGIFYVPTGPYVENQLLDVHRIHTLLGEVNGTELLEETQDVVDEYMIPHEHQAEYRTETYKRQDDTEATKQVKRILNYFIADEYQSDVLDEVTRQIGHEQPDVRDFYIRESELCEMHDAGMTIGGHTITHPVLSKLNKNNQRKEISGSLQYLDRVVDGLSERTFCYPYGDSYTFDENTTSILNEVGCEWCFKVEPSDVSKNIITQETLALPRYDCTEFPHGKASGSIGSSRTD